MSAMNQHPEWVIDQREQPIWQAPNLSRRVSLLVSKQQCGSEHLSAGLFWVAQGMTVYIPAGVTHQSFNDGDEELWPSVRRRRGTRNRRRKDGNGPSSRP